MKTVYNKSHVIIIIYYHFLTVTQYEIFLCSKNHKKQLINVLQITIRFINVPKYINFLFEHKRKLGIDIGRLSTIFFSKENQKKN